MHIETMAIRAGYQPKDGETHTMPIYQSTTYEYTSSEYMAHLFDCPTDGHIYSRISNPTCGFVEDKIAAMEGGVAAMLTTSGQSANLLAILNICKSGDHIVSAGAVYGGTVNLLAVTLKRLGIECTFVNQDDDLETLRKAIRPNTKLVFGETIANPAMAVLDIEKFATLAHENNIPLFVDNTFATPVLCRPFEFGADIVIHSTTKYMDGHAVQVGGVIVDGGKFDWANGKFPEFTTPDASYHGIVYKDYGAPAFVIKCRMQLMRDFGVLPSAQDAFLLDLGLQTLPLRVERHCQNAQKVAEYLEASDKVTWVNYPGLKSCKYYDLAQKYLPKGSSGVISFGVKGGRAAATKFMDSLKLGAIVTHVADARTCLLHPASTTHRQMTDEQLCEAGVLPDLIRLSVGIEDVEDIIADIEQALCKM